MTTKSLLAFAGVALLSAVVAIPTARADDKEKKVQQDQKTTNPDAHKQNKDKQKDAEKSKAKEEDKAKDKDKSKSAGAVVGQPAPAFSLPDTEGTTVNLADTVKDAKHPTLIVWFNRDCPVIKAHFGAGKTFNELYTKYHEKGVNFIAVCSSAKGNQGYGKDVNADGKKSYEMPYPVLLDESGDVGKAYGAKTTPHVFILAKDGTLAYKGAIDNGNEDSNKKNYVNYAAKALDELLAGTQVSTPETKPYGCGVKYAK